MLGAYFRGTQYLNALLYYTPVERVCTQTQHSFPHSALALCVWRGLQDPHHVALAVAWLAAGTGTVCSCGLNESRGQKLSDSFSLLTFCRTGRFPHLYLLSIVYCSQATQRWQSSLLLPTSPSGLLLVSTPCVATHGHACPLGHHI